MGIPGPLTLPPLFPRLRTGSTRVRAVADLLPHVLAVHTGDLYTFDESFYVLRLVWRSSIDSFITGDVVYSSVFTFEPSKKLRSAPSAMSPTS